MFIIEKYYLFPIIMRTNNPNANLIEAMKDKLPLQYPHALRNNSCEYQNKRINND